MSQNFSLAKEKRIDLIGAIGFNSLVIRSVMNKSSSILALTTRGLILTFRKKPKKEKEVLDNSRLHILYG
jgi:hypothetical protein